MRSGSKRAKLFSTGGSQALRLPREFRFNGSEVAIHREGDRVVLEPVASEWTAEFTALLSQPAPEFPDRKQPRELDARVKL